MSILGNEVRRVEDPRMLTQGGRYVSDLLPDGALCATFVRSQMAHGEILDVDTADAEVMPGVVAVYTADTLAVPPSSPMMAPPMFGRPALASGRVRYVGEPVAVVISETAAQGEDAAELVFVDIDPLPVVVDPERAVDADPIYADADSNVVVAMPAASEISFDDCEVVVTERVVNSRVAASPIEPRVSAAYPDNGRITCLSATQGAHPAQAELARALEVEATDVRVITPDVGGGFGSKAGPGPEEGVVAKVRAHSGATVAWIETRTENLMAMGHGRAQIQYCTMGGTRDGKITHYKLETLQDSGAYADIGSVLPMFTGMMLTGVYDIANTSFSNRSVVTNTAPVVAFRGAGPSRSHGCGGADRRPVCGPDRHGPSRGSA